MYDDGTMINQNRTIDENRAMDDGWGQGWGWGWGKDGRGLN